MLRRVYQLFLCVILFYKLQEVVSETHRPLPNGFPTGSIAVITGIPMTNETRKSFNINLLTHSPFGESGNKAFHLAAQYGLGIITTNTLISGSGWQKEVNQKNSPIEGGRPFEIMIIAKTSFFSVYVNGKHFLDFSYRMPLQGIKHLEVTGQVIVTSVTVDVAVGHAWPLPNGFPVGSRAVITGIPNAIATDKVFSLNFLTYSPYGYFGDVAYRLEARYGEGNIASNNFNDCGWQYAQLNRDVPIQSGRQFNITISSKESQYSVFINNTHVFDFSHRVSLDRIKYFQVRGNVTILSMTFDNQPLDSGHSDSDLEDRRGHASCD